MWNVILDPIADWLRRIDDDSARQILAAITVLQEEGPNLKRPLVGKIEGSSTIKNLKELRPGSHGRSEIRILFTFDPKRNAIMLVGGDKQRKWNKWYPQAIRQAETNYIQWLEQQEREQQ